MEIIALYPGQGSQERGMGRSLWEASAQVRDLYEKVSDLVKINLRALIDEGSEGELTRHAQLIITLVNRSAHIRLKELGFHFAAHSGFSLGELSAYAAAAIIDDITLFQIIQKRVALMEEASAHAATEHGELAMAAVIGLDSDRINEVLKNEKIEHLWAANDNAPTQVVLSGTMRSLEAARKALSHAGARRIVPLRVAGPFHTPFMSSATTPFSYYLDSLPFFEPKEKVISSVDGSIVQTSLQARANLAGQLARPVVWTKVMRVLDAMNKPFGEVGHGSVLAGLAKHNKTDASCSSLGREEAIERFMRNYQDE